MNDLVEQVKGQIRRGLVDALTRCRKAGEIDFDTVPEFVVEVPREKEHGDFAANLAMVLAKQARQAPRKLAEFIVARFTAEGTWVERIEVAGAGFINFTLKNDWLYDLLPVIEKMGARYGTSDIGGGEKVQVEFVSANPTGLLHMGNARGAALGDTVAGLLEAAGFEVTREFYVNDAGNQIENFGKSLEARYLQALGHDVPFPEEGYHGQDIIDTVQGLVEEKGRVLAGMAPEARKEFLIEQALQEKLTAIKKSLATFGVQYDVWFHESSLYESGEIEDTIECLKENGYLYEKEGALWFKATAFGDEKDEVLVRSNGTPTYFAADIAYHRNKFERGFKRVINIWGADHHGHVQRMKGAVKAFGFDPDSLDIIIMQLVRLFKGGEIVRMSKRTGEFVTLDELVEEVGKDAARYFFIMRSADSHLDFDMDLAKSQSNENPVFYIQYAYARICSIFRQLREAGLKEPTAGEVGAKLTLLKESVEIELLRKMADLPGEVASAAVNLEPHRLARLALDLAGSFHSFYNSHRVIVDDEDLRQARLVLLSCTRTVLGNILGWLGITAPERM